jgi:transcriptional regulator with XRE-family HTH domain
MADAASIERSIVTQSFGGRLRAQRERNGISLDAIARNTKISITLFEGLERNDASRWPTGIFRRAFIRSYANAIGLDPEATVKEFLERFPDPSGAVAGAVADTNAICATGDDPPLTGAAGLRLTLADEPVPLSRRRLNALLGRWQRASAAVYDVAVVIAVATAVFAVAGLFWRPLTVVTVCYYFGGVLALGNSPGVWLAARGRTRATRPDPRLMPLQLSSSPESGDETDNLRQFSRRRYPTAV